MDQKTEAPRKWSLRGQQSVVNALRHFTGSEGKETSRVKRKWTAIVKSLCYSILALGEGCNTLLMSANSSKACPSCHALVLSLYMHLAYASLTLHMHTPSAYRGFQVACQTAQVPNAKSTCLNYPLIKLLHKQALGEQC